MELTKSCTALLSACITCMIAIPSQSKPFLTIICDAPVGARVEVGGPALKQSGKMFNFSADSFTGINPTFIVDDTDLGTLTYLFGDTKSATDQGLKQRPARYAHVVTLTYEMISAIETTGSAIATFSFYPEIGIGFFTFHEAKPISGADAKAATFIAKCSFAT
ncbi:hypothetical protein [Pseudomonas chlororaphis]|uniref:hypothetical protein n=2 Tax=Pseudomonas chlororaphis TaxID=587753 RepID=UPI001B3187F4|nr:hypothetical protein [Pseudomonas chlororaphis]MBP5057593.1 hypothetical protein [Pseudomonas chlororaphis]MBP5142122.1 hypothetical protein [Pseudomonas chlororaphis]QTT99109.1 hypothetical protein HUT26_07455 [Pseudomonas chlororaphis]